MKKHDQAFSSSMAALNEASKFIPSGVTSAARIAAKPTPLVIEKAEGVRLFDVDGNVYIDYVMGFGPLLLGHTPPALISAVERQINKGFLYGCAHKNEGLLAKQLVECLPCAEQVIFSNTGSEAVHIALRLARAFTNRRLIVKFEGQYHGWFDAVSYGTPGQAVQAIGESTPRAQVRASKGLPTANADMVILPWNDKQAIQSLFSDRGEEIAAVIMEGIPQAGAIEPDPDYLSSVRQLTERHGSLMIMDEVITGFRMGLGGAHGIFNIKPDLCVLGKALGAGYAISAVAGREEILALTQNGKVPHMGTFNGHALHVVAALTALKAYAEPNFYDGLNRVSNALADGMKKSIREFSLPLKISQYGALINVLGLPQSTKVNNYSDLKLNNPTLVAAFSEQLIRHGVSIQSRGTLMPSSAHSTEHIEETLLRIQSACADLRDQLEIASYGKA